jgi:hypothetical protein
VHTYAVDSGECEYRIWKREKASASLVGVQIYDFSHSAIFNYNLLRFIAFSFLLSAALLSLSLACVFFSTCKKEICCAQVSL